MIGCQTVELILSNLSLYQSLASIPDCILKCSLCWYLNVMDYSQIRFNVERIINLSGHTAFFDVFSSVSGGRKMLRGLKRLLHTVFLESVMCSRSKN